MADDPFTVLLREPGVREELDLRGRLGFCAYHGGNLERQTDHVARQAANRSGSSYYAVIQSPTLRRHVPSTRVDPAVSERFRAFVEHCEFVITIHGFGRRGYFTSILCGGRNRDLAGHVADHLRRAVPCHDAIDELERIPKGLRGTHRLNPCNLTRGGGVQVELPPRLRGVTPAAIHWHRSNNGRRPFPLLEDLIDGLAEAARTWTDGRPDRPG